LRFKAEHPALCLKQSASKAKRIEALDALLAEWIRTYNEHRGHSSLRTKTPQETRKEALTPNKVRIP